MTIDEFKAADLRIGTITTAERVAGSEKMLKLEVNLGELDPHRQILSGIGKAIEPEALVGKQALFIVNLEPRSIMGLESQGMLLATDHEGAVVLITPATEVLPGATIH